MLDLVEKGFDSEDDKFMIQPYYSMLPVLETVEADYVPKLERFFEEEAKKIVKFLKQFGGDLTTKDPESELYDLDLIQDIRDNANWSVQKSCEVGVLYGVSLVEKGVGKRVSIDTKEVAKKSAGMFLKYSSDLRGRSMKNSIIKIIRKGIDGGLSVDEVADLLRTKFKDMSPHRASMIARTETMGALNQALDITYQEVNRQAGKIVVKRMVIWPSLLDRDWETCP